VRSEVRILARDRDLLADRDILVFFSHNEANDDGHDFSHPRAFYVVIQQTSGLESKLLKADTKYFYVIGMKCLDS
jgi:hypothetical protein